VKKNCESVNDIINKDTFYYKNTLPSSNTSAVPPPDEEPRANADSGTNGHYFALKDMHCLSDVQPSAAHEIITVKMPNGEEIKSSFTGKLNYDNIPQHKRVHIFKTLWGSLLSIGELCDSGLIAVFTAEAVYIVDVDKDNVVLSGDRDPITKLWMIKLVPISNKEEQHAVSAASRTKTAVNCANSIVEVQQKNTKNVDQLSGPEKTEGKAALVQGQANGASAQKLDNAGDRVEFFSRTFSSAAESTLMNAVKKKWIKFPGITSNVLKRHRQRLRTHESAAGHLDQVHQNHKPHAPRSTTSITIEHAEEKPITVLTTITDEGNHMDATGRFPAISHHGHEYMLVMYGGNYIKILPMTSRNKSSYLKAHREGLAWFTDHEKPNQRNSWSKHGVKGFYLGPAMLHYRCYHVWTTHSGSTRTADTVAWHPKGYEWEQYSPLEMVSSAADMLTTAINHLATSDTTLAAHRQPLQHAAHDITRDLDALKAVFAPPLAEADDTTPRAVQRVPTTATADDPAPVQRVPAAPISPPPALVEISEQPPPALEEAVVFRSPPSRRSQRRQHKWLNRPAPAANAIIYTTPPATHDPTLSYKERRALMRAERANGSKKQKKLRKWAAAVFAHRPTYLANTAVDLDDHGRKLSMTTALAGEDGHLWLEKHGEEITRLFESETIRLIDWNALPAGKTAAYYNPQVRTKIKDGVLQRRVRGTIGGDRVDYDGDTAAHTASMQVIKIFLNAVVSDSGSKFMTADIKDFYLGTPLPNTEYMRIKLDHIPQHVIDRYAMADFAHNNAVIVAVDKGIYGLPQAGILAQDRLVKHLATHGYKQAEHTPCLFRHESNSVSFTLVVDDFGIKYKDEADADHLLAALRELYIMTEDRATKQKYVGITIDHDRDDNAIYLTMPGYVNKAMTRFGTAKRQGAKSPIIYIPPLRGPAQQMVPDVSPEAAQYVDATMKTYVQEVTGVFLFYSRAVDPTMLMAVNRISTQQSKPTKATLTAVDRLLSYAERYPNATIVIRPSDMQLCVQSDASYLSEQGARSRAGGILHFGLNQDGSVNGAIDYMSCIIPTVCSSVAEAEYAALFLAGKEATNARNILHDLGYPQKTTRIICDNACAVGIATDSVKQKRSKAIDMRYHWTRDQVRQGKFSIHWEKGATNLADYFTKAHPVHHCVNMRHIYVYTPKPATIKPTTRSRRIAHRISKIT